MKKPRLRNSSKKFHDPDLLHDTRGEIMRPPRLKSKPDADHTWPYDCDDIPDELIYEFSEKLLHMYYIGKNDITGSEWDTIFAKSIGGKQMKSPVGHADVIKDNCAWSVKTVKCLKPHTADSIRIISGRNSPQFSYGNIDSTDNQAMGNMVLGIWNARVKEAKQKYPNGLHTSIMVRNMDKMQFTYFELESLEYLSHKYIWKQNNRNNLEGYDQDGNHIFTWQPHGGQFTIIYKIPKSAKKFSMKKIKQIRLEDLIKDKIELSWIKMEK